MNSHAPSSEREQRLDEVIAFYLDEVAQGQGSPRAALLARHPDLAADLEMFFADQDCFDRLASPLRQISDGTAEISEGTWPFAQPSATPAFGDTPLDAAPSEVAPSTRTTLDESRPQPDLPFRPNIPGYDILEEIGRGGMGVVYKARQISLKRFVALKMMRAGPGVRPEQLVRFRAEAEAVARLRHPNVVQIHEVGAQEGFPFFCLELIEGGSLAKKLAGAPLPPKAAAELVLTLARAMHYAHQCGIIHRDLKPANILLAGEPGAAVEQCVPKVSDFGLAKQLGSEMGGTRTGEIVGTPSYMAPEQAQGRSKDVGPPADIYALGAILYELLTGRPPFKAATPLDTVLQVVHSEALPPSRLQPTVPRDLETICLKCLQKEPHRRFASAEALADDLHRFVRGEPIHARPATLRERTVKWVRRQPAMAALIALSAFVLVGAIVGVIGWNLLLEQEVEEARAEATIKAEETEQTKQALARAQAVTARRQECQPILEQARAALTGKKLDLAETLAAKARDRVGEEPDLADIRARADRVLAESQRRRMAVEKLRTLFKGVDEAHLSLHPHLFTGLDAATDLAKARQSAEKGLDLFPEASRGDGALGLDERYSAEERDEILLCCFELMLILADIRGSPGSNREAAQEALRILDRANQLVPATQVYQRRRARYLALVDDEAGARAARAKAEALPVANAVDAYLVGVDLLQEGKPQQARGYLERAVQKQRDLFWARFFLALDYLKLRQPLQAIAHLTVCESQRPEFIWTYVVRGFIHGELGDFEAADADFDGALRRTQDKAVLYVVHVNRGVLRTRQQRYPDAMRALKTAMALQPQQFHAYLNLVAAYQAEQKRAEIIHELLGVQPQPFQVFRRVLLDSQRRERLDEAVRRIDEALRLKPGLALLYRQRAQVHLQRRDLVAAVADFDAAIQHQPVGPETHADYLDCGLILTHQGRYQDAVRACDASLLLKQDYAPAQRLRGEVCLKLGKYEEALRSFDRYLALGPPLADVCEGRALALGGLGKLAALPSAYDRALQQRPKDPALYAARGWAYLLNEAPILALPDFEQAVRLDPGNAHARTGLGFALVKRGKPVEGARQAAKALDIKPHERRTLYAAARVFAQAAAAFDTAAARSDRAAAANRDRYVSEGVRCLTQALASLEDEEKRGEFWQQVRNESFGPGTALYPLRQSDRFNVLAAYYDRLAERPAEGKARPAALPK